MGEITFEDLIQYGRDIGSLLINNMPQSFYFINFNVFREQDDCYIISDTNLLLEIGPGQTFIYGSYIIEVVDS